MPINIRKIYECVKLTGSDKYIYIVKDRFPNIVMVVCNSLTSLV